MPTFLYKTKDLEGNEHKGTIETGDEHSAARLLSKKGLVVISIKIKEDGKGSFIHNVFNRVSFSELVIMTRQLATMVQAGIVLSEALDILEEQQENKKFKEVLGQVSRDIKAGLDLASALKKHPSVFPPIYGNLVKAGESSGKLDTILLQMATSFEKEREFRSRVRGAMIYPILVLIMMGVVILIMMFFVIPRLVGLYTQSGIELPLPTKILIGSSSFLTNYWWMLLILIVVSVYAIRKWLETESGREKFDTILLRIPIIGKVIATTSLTNLTRIFGLLISAGVPILDSLIIVSDVISNRVYKQTLKRGYQGVERGLPLSTQLDQQHIFPKMVSQMIKVGEETGKLDEISFKMADYYESEADNLIKNLTVVIEPIILIILGIGVAFLVISIILPIYKLTTNFTQ